MTLSMAQVPLDVKSMNEGDVFILDAGRHIFQWNGKSASRVEKSKGLEVTKQVRDQERGGNAKVYIVDSGKDDDTLFWEKFGVAKPTKIAAEGADDEAHQQARPCDIGTFPCVLRAAGGCASLAACLPWETSQVLACWTAAVCASYPHSYSHLLHGLM